MPAQGTSVEEENAAIIRRVVEAVNRGDVGPLEQLMGPEQHELPPMAAGQSSIKMPFRDAFGALRSGFPDAQIVIDDIITSGDKVVARMTLRGTHQGSFLGIPATNKKIELTGIHIARIENGRQVDHWGEDNYLGLLQQLGVVKL